MRKQADNRTDMGKLQTFRRTRSMVNNRRVLGDFIERICRCVLFDLASSDREKFRDESVYLCIVTFSQSFRH